MYAELDDLRSRVEKIERKTDMDEITYNNADGWAAEASNDELLERHEACRADDQFALRQGGRGMIDDPYWNAAKRELIRRGALTPPIL